MALAAQACGGKANEVSITPSSTPGETLVPTISNTQTPEITLEPTTVPTPEPTSTLDVSPPATPTPLVVPTLSVEAVKLKFDSGQDFTLVDVRDKASFDKSRLDTAISIPFDELPLRVSEIPQRSEIIVYAGCA
jgi:hypothetical protein